MRLILLLPVLILVSCSSIDSSHKDVLRGPASVEEDTRKFKDDVVLISSECKIVGVNMVDGKIKSADVSDLIVGCFVKGYNADCKFLDEKGKVYATTSMIAGINGQEGVISTKAGTDVFIINMVTRKFYSSSNINYEHGAVRGSKICAGDFMYKHEADALKK